MKKIKLFEEFVGEKVKPYQKNLVFGEIGETESSIEYYINLCNTFINNQLLTDYQMEYITRFLTQMTDNTEDELNSMTVEEKQKLVKKLLTYMKKDLAEVKRKNREYRRQESQMEMARKLLAKKERVTFSGDADESILSKILYELKLWGKIKKDSRIEIYASTSRVDRESSGSIELWNVVAQGWIELDGRSYKFDNVVVGSGGYDHHYYDY